MCDVRYLVCAICHVLHAMCDGRCLMADGTCLVLCCAVPCCAVLCCAVLADRGCNAVQHLASVQMPWAEQFILHSACFLCPLSNNHPQTTTSTSLSTSLSPTPVRHPHGLRLVTSANALLTSPGSGARFEAACKAHGNDARPTLRDQRQNIPTLHPVVQPAAAADQRTAWSVARIRAARGSLHSRSAPPAASSDADVLQDAAEVLKLRGEQHDEQRDEQCNEQRGEQSPSLLNDDSE
ncbi:hypothetical protein GQ42DRAFT_180519 [Ramicandelaber brevisporus]|nr:hypothetical protein GQ42DRAFT_180519 [Ramicandelaber brevisporus]